MKTFTVHGEARDCPVHVGGVLEDAVELCPPGTVIVTDEVVAGLYGNRFPDFPVITIGQGEGIKTLDTARDIYGLLLELGADRDAFILAIGGGIVCDVAGFAASTWLRGIRFGFVATTLLAQVDASVGGKNGVNFERFKNMVGTFTQPGFVICDTRLLTTLSKRELSCGFAEIVKHGLIADADYFDYLESNAEKAITLDEEVINQLVLGSVEIKAGVVSRDEREAGERRKLNFGHTFGHAVEKTSAMNHGEAVAVGMLLAAKLSAGRGLIDENEVHGIQNLLEKLGLPTKPSGERREVLDALVNDKKRAGEDIRFVLLESVGSARVEKIPIRELRDFLADEVFV